MATTVEPIPEWKVKQAHAECMQDDVFAERFNNAPQGARTRLALECYHKVFGSEVSDEVYAVYCAEVDPALSFEDLKYLLRTEKDPLLLERWKDLLLKCKPTAPTPVKEREEEVPAPVEEEKKEPPAEPEKKPEEAKKELSEEENKSGDEKKDEEKKEPLAFLAFIPVRYRVAALAAAAAALVILVALPFVFGGSGSAVAGKDESAEADEQADSLDDLMDGKEIAAYDKSEHPASGPVEADVAAPAAEKAAEAAGTGDALFDELFSSESAAPAASSVKAAPAMPVAREKKPASNALPTGIDAPAQPPPKPREVLESTLPPKPELTAEERASLEPVAKIDIVPLMARKRKLVAELEELQKNNPAVEFAASENEKNIVREESPDTLHYPKGLTVINRRFKCPFRDGAYHNTETGNCEKGGYTDGNCTAFKHWYKWKLLLDKVERTKIYNQKIDEKDALVKEVAAKVTEILEARRKLGQ